MAWHTRKSTRSSFGGSTTYRYGSLESTDPLEDGSEEGSSALGRTRLRSSVKEAELRDALKAGATPAQLRDLLAALETLAAGLGPNRLLDWSVRFEPGPRSLCLRWRQRDPTDTSDPTPWQTRRFGGKAAGASVDRHTSGSRGFG